MPYKNVEKRREKSRDAARSRRTKEADVFNELTSLLPVSEETVATMDKASVMRIAISYVKLRTVLQNQNNNGGQQQLQHLLEDEHLRCLDAFLLVLDANADVIFASSGVTDVLGLNQLDLLGSSMFDFTHPCDHEELRDACRQAEPPASPIFLRCKCTLSARGRNTSMKSASYKVIKYTGHSIPSTLPDDQNMADIAPASRTCLILLGEGIQQTPFFVESADSKFTFSSRHSMAFKFVDCSSGVTRLLGYGVEEMTSLSMFEFVHSLDAAQIEKACHQLLHKGQVCCGPYRFLAKGGGWAWVVSSAGVLHNRKSGSAECIECTHHVISGVEHAACIVSHVQLPRTTMTSPSLGRRQPRKTCVVRPSPSYQNINTPHIMCAKTDAPVLPVALEKDACFGEKKDLLEEVVLDTEQLESAQTLLPGLTQDVIDLLDGAIFSDDDFAMRIPTPKLDLDLSDSRCDDQQVLCDVSRHPQEATPTDSPEDESLVSTSAVETEDLDRRAPFLDDDDEEDLFLSKTASHNCTLDDAIDVVTGDDFSFSDEKPHQLLNQQGTRVSHNISRKRHKSTLSPLTGCKRACLYSHPAQMSTIDVDEFDFLVNSTQNEQHSASAFEPVNPNDVCRSPGTSIQSAPLLAPTRNIKTEPLASAASCPPTPNTVNRSSTLRELLTSPAAGKQLQQQTTPAAATHMKTENSDVIALRRSSTADVTSASGSGVRQLKQVTLRLMQTPPVSGSQIVITDDIIQQLIKQGRAEVILCE